MGDHLDYLDGFLDACSRLDAGIDGCLKWLLGLQHVVGGGVGDSSKLNIVGGGELGFRNQCIAHSDIEVVSEHKSCQGSRDMSTVAGYDQCPVTLSGRGRSVGGRDR